MSKISSTSYSSLVSLGWLYLIQGIPYGLQDKFIPVQLRSLGLNYSSVSLLKLLLLPWIAKALWAPLVEVWGGKQCWLLVSVLGLGASSFAGSIIAPDDVMTLGAMLLSLNIFSSVQDVAVDGLALQVLPDDQLGLGNTLQVVLYKVGCLVGGAGLTYLLTCTSWPAAFTILALIYVLTGLWIRSLSFKESLLPSGSEASVLKSHASEDRLLENSQLSQNEENKAPSVAKKETSQEHMHTQVERIYHILQEVFYSSGTLGLSLYVLLYKMGERGAVNNMPLYLLDKGFSKENLAFWNGTVCQALSVLGSVHGGIILTKSHVNVKVVLIKQSICRFLIISFQCLLVFMLQYHMSESNIFPLHYASILSLCFLSYSSGVISTATFTFMMSKSRECSKESQASHYSVLASIEIAGKLVFASLAGFIIDYFGMFWTFSLFSFLSTLPIIVLCVIPYQLYSSGKDKLT